MWLRLYRSEDALDAKPVANMSAMDL